MGEVAGPLPGGGGGSHVWAGGPQGSAMKQGTAQMTPEPPFRGQRHSLSPLIRKMELFLCSQHPSLPLRRAGDSLLVHFHFPLAFFPGSEKPEPTSKCILKTTIKGPQSL